MALQHPVDTPPAELLRIAREAAWGEDESAAPNAYDCAIQAIECAFRDIATPDNPTDNLGVILDHWENRPDLWCEGYPRVAEVDTIMPVLANLWQGRPEADKDFPVFLEEARIALTVAEWVVRLLDLGFFELLDELTPEEEAADRALAEQRWNEYQSGQMETRPFEEYVKERAARDAQK